jgi:hypothetical protein
LASKYFWFWTYMMKVSRNASCALNLVSTFLFLRTILQKQCLRS